MLLIKLHGRCLIFSAFDEPLVVTFPSTDLSSSDYMMASTRPNTIFPTVKLIYHNGVREKGIISVSQYMYM